MYHVSERKRNTANISQYWIFFYWISNISISLKKFSIHRDLEVMVFVTCCFVCLSCSLCFVPSLLVSLYSYFFHFTLWPGCAWAWFCERSLPENVSFPLSPRTCLQGIMRSLRCTLQKCFCLFKLNKNCCTFVQLFVFSVQYLSI